LFFTSDLFRRGCPQRQHGDRHRRAYRYIDDVSGGAFWSDGTDHPLFSNDFESQPVVGPQPLSGLPIPIENYVQRQWYLERAESLFTIQQVPFARSGSYVGAADASLN
jgi:hypothetical protein